MVDQNRTILTLATAALALSSCGPSSSSPSVASYAARLAALQVDQTSLTPTPEIDLPSGAVNYVGVANFNLGVDSSGTNIIGVLGALNLDVQFDTDAVTGSVTNFIFYDETAAAGRLDITNGVLTGNNGTSLGSGLDAQAAGTVAGIDLDMTVEGEFLGDNGEMVALWFDDTATLRNGVAVGGR